MPKLTKAQHAALAKLEAARDAAMNEVYASAHPRQDVPFFTCLGMASESVRTTYHAALGALRDAQHDLVAQGRGYWDERHTFQPY